MPGERLEILSGSVFANGVRLTWQTGSRRSSMSPAISCTAMTDRAPRMRWTRKAILFWVTTRLTVWTAELGMRPAKERLRKGHQNILSAFKSRPTAIPRRTRRCSEPEPAASLEKNKSHVSDRWLRSLTLAFGDDGRYCLSAIFPIGLGYDEGPVRDRLAAQPFLPFVVHTARRARVPGPNA